MRVKTPTGMQEGWPEGCIHQLGWRARESSLEPLNLGYDRVSQRFKFKRLGHAAFLQNEHSSLHAHSHSPPPPLPHTHTRAVTMIPLYNICIHLFLCNSLSVKHCCLTVDGLSIIKLRTKFSFNIAQFNLFEFVVS